MRKGGNALELGVVVEGDVALGVDKVVKDGYRYILGCGVKLSKEQVEVVRKVGTSDARYEAAPREGGAGVDGRHTGTVETDVDDETVGEPVRASGEATVRRDVQGRGGEGLKEYLRCTGALAGAGERRLGENDGVVPRRDAQGVVHGLPCLLHGLPVPHLPALFGLERVRQLSARSGLGPDEPHVLALAPHVVAQQIVLAHRATHLPAAAHH
mmetsp:Transcript_1448/g.3894  ORF Transcript_1448/g.3894 Transcript_1448/m.3894 type:complete len:212 (-) Transcript_1448:49-684(-)